MPQNAFEYFIGRENARLVDLLEKNPGVSAVIQGLLEAAVNYCEQRGCRFEQLRLVDSYVLPTPEGDARIEARFQVLGN